MQGTIVQHAQVGTENSCGIDLGPANRHRWHPAYASGDVTMSSRITCVALPFCIATLKTSRVQDIYMYICISSMPSSSLYRGE